MMYDKTAVFFSASLALLLHTFIAAFLGWGLSRLFQGSTLHFAAAALYVAFAVLYGQEWYATDAESDAIAAGTQEASQTVAASPEAAGASADAERAPLRSTKAPRWPALTVAQVFGR